MKSALRAILVLLLRALRLNALAERLDFSKTKSDPAKDDDKPNMNSID
jgi:hypothetical protein